MFVDFINTLVKIDKDVFAFINQQLHVSWLDGIMVLLRNQNVWIVLYLFLIYKVYKAIPKATLPFIVASIITFAITDFTSASIIKPWVGRLRPCHDNTILTSMYQLVSCGGKYSFPSSHAANHFGLATVWFAIIILLQNKRWYWVWPWAVSICYAQIYVGKHFPLDIIAGALLGSMVGVFVSKLFRYWYIQTNGNFTLSK